MTQSTRRGKVWWLSAASSSVLLTVAACWGFVWYQTPAHLRFRPDRVIKPFPPITDPPIVTAEKAAESIPRIQALEETELVLGVVVKGAARAYPINMLTGPHREIINDELGGVSIAATW